MEIARHLGELNLVRPEDEQRAAEEIDAKLAELLTRDVKEMGPINPRPLVAGTDS